MSLDIVRCCKKINQLLYEIYFLLMDKIKIFQSRFYGVN